MWTMRKKGKQIGRMLYTHHKVEELWYLRLLLSNDACKNLCLLDDDNEWHSVIKECDVSGFPEQIRKLFVQTETNRNNVRSSVASNRKAPKFLLLSSSGSDATSESTPEDAHSQ
ncbi:hypothetical protein AgCh_032580 [Apium graveolens]